MQDEVGGQGMIDAMLNLCKNSRSRQCRARGTRHAQLDIFAA